MSDIEELWEQKGYKLEYRKNIVALINVNGNGISYEIPKSVRDPLDPSYKWELTELHNKEFPEEKVKFK